MAARQCPFCGKIVPDQATQCPFCREALQQAPAVGGRNLEQARKYIRRGILYMVMAGVAHYYLGGYSPTKFPFTVLPEVTQYLLPFLLLSGIGLAAFGLYRRYVS